MNADELRKAFAELPPIDGVPKPHTWDRHRYELRRHVARDNPRDFLRWATIQATMFVGDAPYVKKELEDLPDELYDVIHEPWFGNPPYLPYAPSTSGNLVHQATHLRMLIEMTDVSVFDLHGIVEFGGGYGAMALLCQRLGFKGNYTIVDFPEFQELQYYYLTNVGVKAESVGVLALLLEPWEIDLLIACYSLSEAPQETRDLVLEKCKANYYLFAFQGVYAGLDLKQEFERIAGKMSDVNWTWIQNPYFHKHTYLIGERK